MHTQIFKTNSEEKNLRNENLRLLVCLPRIGNTFRPEEKLQKITKEKSPLYIVYIFNIQKEEI